MLQSTNTTLTAAFQVKRGEILNSQKYSALLNSAMHETNGAGYTLNTQ